MTRLFLIVLLVSLLSFACGKLKGKSEYESLGVVLLDAVTYPKVVPHATKSVLILLSNIEEHGQYATDSIREDFFQFAERSELQGNSESILFGQIVVDNLENMLLAEETFSLNRKEFKHPKLVLVNPNGKIIDYPPKGAFNPIALTRWLHKEAEFFLHVPGTIEKFNVLSKKFMASTTVAEKQQILEEASSLAPNVELHQKDDADYYLKMMSRVIERGVEYLNAEINRLEDIVTSERVTDQKKNSLQKRINICHTFVVPQKHDEL